MSLSEEIDGLILCSCSRWTSQVAAIMLVPAPLPSLYELSRRMNVNCADLEQLL